VVRLASYQVFYEVATAKPKGQRGGPASYGPRFPLASAQPRRSPDTTVGWQDSAYGQAKVALYDGLRQKITRTDQPWLGPKYLDARHVPIPKVF
jgi:hypothetical protein